MILCLGLTPALQRTLIFDSLQLDEVNRASRVIISAAGKPVNTARALAVLGVECKLAGFNGGLRGAQVIQYLEGYGVESALTLMHAETRICSTLIDQGSGSVTELIEEAPQPSYEEIECFINDNIELVKSCQLLLICGTLPPFAPVDFYCNFTRAAAENDVPVIIDSHKEGLLSVLSDHPLMAKMNLQELERTFECCIESETQLIELMTRLIAAGAQSVLITQGRKPSFLLEGEHLSKFIPPEIDQCISPIGSGDCTTAGIAASLANGGSWQDAVKLGMACGSANVEQLLPSDISRERVMQLMS